MNILLPFLPWSLPFLLRQQTAVQQKQRCLQGVLVFASQSFTWKEHVEGLQEKRAHRVLSEKPKISRGLPQPPQGVV